MTSSVLNNIVRNMAEGDMSKTAFRCPSFIGLFEWLVMTFGF
jgi:hypothetical protein